MQSEIENETTVKKTNSRKFVAFIIVTVFCLAGLIYGVIFKETALVEKSIDIELLNALIYAGGNVGTKYIKTKYGIDEEANT